MGSEQGDGREAEHRHQEAMSEHCQDRFILPEQRTFPRPTRPKALALFLALDPHVDFARLVSRLDMHDARTTAHGAILGVRLALTTTEVDGKLVSLTAEGTHDLGSLAARAFRHRLQPSPEKRLRCTRPEKKIRLA